MNSRSYAAAALFVWLAVSLGAQSQPPAFEQLPEQLGPNSWLLTWKSESGALYRLERSFDLQDWTPVGTIAGLADFTSMFDHDVFGQPVVYWRVVVDGDGGALVISELLVDYHVQDSAGSATYQVRVSGSQAVAELLFRTATLEPIGNAEQGPENTWILNMDWDLAVPQPLLLHAAGTTVDGTTAESAPRGFLLANPEQFVPLSASGELLHGQLIQIGEEGTLAAFRYYPEGTGNLARSTGVHFEFPAGARLETSDGTTEILFDAGLLFRSGSDSNPVASAGAGSLPLEGLSPQALRNSFHLPPGPVQLQWGGAAVDWQGGNLGQGGWSHLFVRLPIGAFALPDGRHHAEVAVDPKSGEPYLLVTHFGEWSPIPGGPLFRIPESDPLKLYLGQGGTVSGHGTAEAEFSAGTTIRGTIAWRKPNFEFRFEGKGIVIPALDRLRGLLPADPLGCAPVGMTASELDTFTECLQGYQAAFRGLASGGAMQADPATPGSFTALPRPTDQAGAALEAWAGRIQSWAGDRSGQVLTEDALRDLAAVIAQTARTGEAASDLPTVLNLLRHTLILAGPLDAVRGTGTSSDSLADTVAVTGQRLLATAERLVAKEPANRIPTGMAECATLLQEIDRLIEILEPTPVPQPSRDSEEPQAVLRASYTRLTQNYSDGIGPSIFARHAIMAGDLSGSANPVLQAMDEEELLSLLQEVLGVLDVHRAEDRLITRVSQVIGGPDTPPLFEAWRQIQGVFPGRHSASAAAAFQSSDFERIRQSFALRARYFRLHDLLGEKLRSDDPMLLPPTIDLADAFLREQARRPGSVLVTTCGADIDTLDAIITHTLDAGEFSDLRHKLHQAASCLALLSRDNGAQAECDPVYFELLEAGLQVENPHPSEDNPRTVRLTGRYESTGSGAPATMQLNQSGRLLLGWFQVHGLSNRRTYRERIIGMLKSESPDTAEFHILRREDDGSFLGRKTILPAVLVATTTPQGVNLQRHPLPGKPGSVVSYIKTTEFPAFSPLLSNLFEGEAQEIFLAQQGSPLHSSQIAAVRAKVETGASSVLAGILQYTNVAPGLRASEALNLGRTLDGVAAEVTREQLPLARQILREMLSRSSFEAEGERLSAWNWMRVIFGRHNQNTPEFEKFRDFMGPEIDQQFSGNSFKYKVHIETDSAGIGAGVVGLGLTYIRIEIEKSRTDGVGLSQDILLHGAIGQLGAGLSVFEAPSVGTGEDDIEVYSDIDYPESSLAGTTTLIGATASAGIGITAGTVGPSLLILYGDRSLPPLSIPLPFVSGSNTLVLPSLEYNAGMGRVFEGSEVPPSQFSLSIEPANRSYTAESGLGGAVHFDLNVADLRKCGWAELRALVAEMRAIFESESGSITILGFGDATGTDAINDALTQDRADNVAAALVVLTGDDLGVPPDRIRAIGLGRRPSMGLASPNEALLNEFETAFLARKTARLPVLQDGEANQEWRSVSIILNNLVSIDLNAPGSP